MENRRNKLRLAYCHVAPIAGEPSTGGGFLKISEVATALNELSVTHPFGRFPEVRRVLKGDRASRVLFDLSKKSVNDDEGWAFHCGGSGELQYNIGFEKEGDRFRFGVAFSFETSPSFRSIEPLNPKREKFNEWIRIYPSSFEGFRMQVWRHKKLYARDTAVRKITDDEARKGNFVFMGRFVPSNAVNPQEVLDCFEELLDVYRFVEAGVDISSSLARTKTEGTFSFKENVVPGGQFSTRTFDSNILSVTLRSNQIRDALCKRLSKDKAGLLGQEIASGNDGRIDLVCKLPSGEYDFYEIKPAVLARHAIREALPQLLEYAYRKGGQEARRLVIVSQASLDEASEKFLERLRDKSLPVFYEQVKISD